MSDKRQLNLHLTNSVNRPDAQIIYPVLSECGDLLFVAYQYPIVSSGSVAAELFRNVNGELVSIRQFFLTSEFPVAQAGGAASHDFSRFVVLTQEAFFGSGRALITVLDENFNVIASRILENFPLFTLSLLTANAFTPGNSFITLSYANTFAPDQISNLLVLDTNTLATVAETTFSGFSNGPSFFTLKDKCGCLRYFIFLAAAGATAGNTFIAPASAYVWEFFPKNLKLVLRDQVGLPQFSPTHSIVAIKKHRLALIGVGTHEAQGKCEISPSTTPQLPLSTRDGHELRLYTFDGKELCLVISQDIGATVAPLEIHPSGKYLVYGLESDALTALSPAFAIDLKNKTLVCSGDKLHPIPGSTLDATFSENGKWFATGGSGSQGLNAIQLYFVEFSHAKKW